MVVRLHRRPELANEGIYYCTVSDAKEKRQQIYVGLYYPGNGIHIQIFSIISIGNIILYDGISFTEDNELIINTPSPVSPLEDLLPLSLGPETPPLSLKELRLC